MNLHRRTFLQGGAGLALSTLQPTLWSRRPAHIPRLDRILLEKAQKLRGQREITLQLVLPMGSEANVRPLVDRFFEGCGVAIDLEITPVDEISTRLITRTLAGQASFDLALPPTFGLAELVANEALLCLDDLAEQHEPKDFSNGSLFGLGDRVNDRLFGYQTDGDTYLAFYHREWLEDEAERRRFLDETGHELAPAVTWEDLDRQLAFFHRPKEGRYGGRLFRNPAYLPWEWWLRLHSKGVFPVDDQLQPRADSDEGVAALEDLIAASKHLAPSVRTDGLFENWKAFGAGDSFANLGWGGTQKFLHGKDVAMRGRLTFGPTPGGTFGGQRIPMPYFNWGWNYAVGANSEHPELAYLFALYASTPELSTLAVRAKDGFFDPFRAEHYQDREVVDTYSKPFLEVHQTSMRDSIPDFYLRGHGEYFDVLRRYLPRAESGQLEVRRALELVTKSWNAITDRIGRDHQIAQWQLLKQRYPAAIRAHLR